MSTKSLIRIAGCVVALSVMAFVGSRIRNIHNPEPAYVAGGMLNPQPINMPGFPTSIATLAKWIESNDQAALRAHAWDLWAGITSVTPDSQGWPVWETWYTDTEVRSGPPVKSVATQKGKEYLAARRSGRPVHSFHRPRQFQHLSGSAKFLAPLAAASNAEQIIGFNKFNTDYAQFIWNLGLYVPDNLWKIQNHWTSDTEIAKRTTPLFPASAISLKPVFQVVHGPNNMQGITLLQYWLGNLTTGPNNSTDKENPGPSTWKQCVVVKTGTVEPPADLICPKGGAKPSGVVGLDRFFHFQLTQAEAVEICVNQEQPDVQHCPVRAGDYAVLVAMHMSTNEDVKWTWETYWWNYNQPFPYGAPPANIKPPFNNYAMCTADSMTINPVNSTSGTNVLCYNPYLETTLSGVTGTNSNCMSCHATAGFGNNPNNFEGTANPSYPLFSGTNWTDYIYFTNTADQPAYFDCTTRTNFSWFLAGIVGTDKGTQATCNVTASTSTSASKRK
jgi:hypothetical protein